VARFLCILYLIPYLLSGLCVSRCVFSDDRGLKRLWLGLVVSMCMLMWLPALFSFALGFKLISQILALVAACCIGVIFFLKARKKTVIPFRLAGELPSLGVVLPLFLLSMVILSTHTLLKKDGGLWVGQSTYGDLAMHLGFITSIATQGTFPPMYSICPDKLVGYPFLSSSVGATFYLLGADLRFCVMLTAGFALLIVFLGVYFFFEEWLERKNKAVFSTLLFFVGGGFGFAYFFDLLKKYPDNLSRCFTAFYETPTNLVDYGMRWVNPIADMMIPQRALLFGWTLLFACLYLLYRAAVKKDRRMFVPLGILAGCLPLVHTHSFLALGIMSAFFFLRSLIKNEEKAQLVGYLKYLGIVLLLAGPQLLIFTFPQSNSSLQFHFNWANEADNYFWFYIKNLGLLICLLPVALIASRREDKALFGSAALIWAIAEVVQFQPNPYDNNKLLFVWFAVICGLVGSWLMDTRERLMVGDRKQRVSIRVLSVLVCGTLFASGIMTLGRECVSSYQLIDPPSVEAADYVKEHAAPDATFLTANNHNNCIAALTGRNIVCGSGSYLFFHGIDYSARENALSLMYEQPELYFQALRAQYHVDYVLIGDYELSAYACNTQYFRDRYPVFYENDRLVIYDVRS
jgi:hypothetical protein